MHQALHLPEIITAIVRAGKTEPGLLYSCLFVNKLFFSESCRILWKGCYGVFGVGHVTPKISDLGNMVLRPDIGRERSQFYADFIRVLVFQEDEFSGEDDARWHPQLRELRFPLLEDLNIWKTRSAEESNTEETILHYVHSGLRDLRVDASGPLSDGFLDEISRLCPRLQQLDIDFKNVTISKKGLARFLQQMLSLEGIHVAALDKSWSAEAFAAVAKYERLKLLHVPAVHDTWFDILDSPLSSTFFPALKYLYCLDTTGKALLRLHGINSRLEALHVYNGSLPSPEDVLPAAAQFTRLTNFRYQPGPNAHITGQNLLKLAQSCPYLTSLSIGQDQATIPIGTDITDSVVYSLAQNLPSLRELYLLHESPFPPSIASTLSAFSQHCPMLNTLDTSCGSDWTSFSTPHNKPLFPHLWTITLRPQSHMEEVLAEPEFNTLLRHFKQHAAEWFPRVEFFNIDDADNWEQQLNDYMYDVGYKREHGSDAESNESGVAWNEDEDEDGDLEGFDADLAGCVVPLDLSRD